MVAAAGLAEPAATGPQPVTVTLRRPPPLDTDLVLTTAEDTTRLLDGSEVIAEAERGPGPGPDPVDPVTVAVAADAEESYAGARDHPFPTCFVCGPDRAPGDGLRLRPGPVTDRTTACRWTPDPGLADDDGLVESATVWAALDCPSAWTTDITSRPLVLGRITAAVDRRPRAGEPLVVVARHQDTVDRKTWTATTVYDAAGGVVGRAAQLWISIDPRTFGGR